MASDVNNPLLDYDEDEEFSLPSLNDDLFLDGALPVVVNEPGTFPSDGGEDVPLPSFDFSPAFATPKPSPAEAAPVADDSPAPGEIPLEKPVEASKGAEDSSITSEATVAEEAVSEPLGVSPSFQSTFGGLDDLRAAFEVEDEEDEDVAGEDVRVLDEYYNQFGEDEEDEEDPLGGFDIDVVLAEAIDMGASDVDIMAYQPVEFTILGEQMRQKQFPIPTEDHMARIQQGIVSHVLNETFVLDMELDASYMIRKGPHKGRRLRLSVGRSLGNVFLCFRVISDRIPTLEELKVSGELASWVKLPKGLVLMNGATGTGKALHVDTFIPTPSGMRRVGEIGVGDELFDERGVPTRVLDVHPSEDTSHFLVRFSNGATVFTAGNHLWEVQDMGRRFMRPRDFDEKAMVLSTSEIASRGVKTMSGTPRWGVPRLSGAVAYPEANLSMSPTEAGALLGRLSPNDDSPLSFDELEEYLISSQAQRVEFLRGFISHAPHSRCRDGVVATPIYYSVVASIVEEMAHSLGWEVSRRGDSGGVISLEIVADEVLLDVDSKGLAGWIARNREYLASPRFLSIASIEAVDDVVEDYVCFEVDSPRHLFLCSRYYVPTHNSTTLASMVQEVQRTRAQKIITIEKPVEYIYGSDGRALVMQREVGRDTRSFSKALENAMRQHPNIILVGEVRNKVEVDALLYAADSGHLAISTTHATSASASVNRIKGFYEGDDLKRVLSSMGELTRGLASQALLKTPDGTSRFAVREVLSVNDEVADLISAGDVKGIQRYQDEREITMEHELVRAVRAGLASLEEARSKTDRPYRFDKIYDSSFAR